MFVTTPDRPVSDPTSASHHVVRRDGSLSSFDATKIVAAITKAFLAIEGVSAAGSARLHDVSTRLGAVVVDALVRRGRDERPWAIEDIQDQVELALMRDGHHKVARAYVLYREARAQARHEAAKASSDGASEVMPVRVRNDDDVLEPLNVDRVRARVRWACADLDRTDPERVLSDTMRSLYDGIQVHEVEQAGILAARALVETDPQYAYVSARLLLARLRREVAGTLSLHESSDDGAFHADALAGFVRQGIACDLLDPELGRYNLDALATALRPQRDLAFQFLGLQTLYDRYLLHDDGGRLELPQVFFMRVAMGLALREVDRETRAIEFYNLLSTFDFMCSSPTLFNAGTRRPQLSSCFLTTLPDDLGGIFKGIADNALLSKYAGGLGNDWSQVRGMGARIRGTNGESQGVVPFLKVANDTAIAVNQGGKRKGAVCAYLEAWHIDVGEFLDLRKNTGDERRRTHDMNTALWVPDLFMQRVAADGDWTLFSPDEVPELHESYGAAFAERYAAREAEAARGGLRRHQTLRARDLWRRMLTMLFETGHPWITFKDPCNLRSPQQHVGVVHSSNLCTEITLNTSADEVAVCNLGSVNLAAHVTPKGLDREHLTRTVRIAVRMLDNVIDINYYTIPEARRSNLRHRPVGLGLMGFQDALHRLRLPYDSDEAVQFADHSMEAISYDAIAASADLAAERGRYPSFAGSLWSQGIMPIDSLERLADARRGTLDVDRSRTLDWDALRERVRQVGMRNSNVLAIAPTATISNICGVTQSIEPTYRNLFVKSNMSGEFTVLDEALVTDLRARGLWDAAMVSDLKYYDGSLGRIDRVPADLRRLYATSFELDSRWLVEAAARRQKWIDQAQSLNLYIAVPSGRQLEALYQLAWTRGLKTTYYLRSLGATQVEKSTLQGTDGKLNAVQVQTAPLAVAACAIGEDGCEVCQ